MALDFGYVENDVREACWYEDPAFLDEGRSRIPAAVLEAFRDDPRAELLAPYARPGALPTRITYRLLTVDETAYCQGLQVEEATGLITISGMVRAALAAFRLACDFPDVPPSLGKGKPKTGRLAGMAALSEGFTAHIQRAYPGLAAFFGRHVLSASTATEAEKKALSPPSTPTRSPSITASPNGETATPAA